jgi:hypothetical protein
MTAEVAVTKRDCRNNPFPGQVFGIDFLGASLVEL